jgi:hypothetical protein
MYEYHENIPGPCTSSFAFFSELVACTDFSAAQYDESFVMVSETNISWGY